ncbi:hypothetical protein THAOC_06000 [Thalassiosira oceanica]|uniref:Zn(2)-C6 fungal-type domain-containing protein n=1 Tax=Thalassiosira oceanica TaxID=159749 RepID=K0T433_THAOC|nr:hypothetical protein THAOC_06000 [Thalassiosira oceanica]|eukprot:EJK72465.1 hypothetical protein THAOC_06000 [Thalassiosira oceanica]
MSPTSANARVVRVEALLAILSVLVPATRAQLGKPRGLELRRSLRDSEGQWTSMSMDFEAKEAPSGSSVVLPINNSVVTSADLKKKRRCNLKKKRRCRKKEDCKWQDGECILMASSESMKLTTTTSTTSMVLSANDLRPALTLNRQPDAPLLGDTGGIGNKSSVTQAAIEVGV